MWDEQDKNKLAEISKQKINDSIREIILEAFGEVSALFMTREERGVDIVMPAQDLLVIANRVVKDLTNPSIQVEESHE